MAHCFTSFDEDAGPQSLARFASVDGWGCGGLARSSACRGRRRDLVRPGGRDLALGARRPKGAAERSGNRRRHPRRGRMAWTEGGRREHGDSRGARTVRSAFAPESLLASELALDSTEIFRPQSLDPGHHEERPVSQLHVRSVAKVWPDRAPEWVANLREWVQSLKQEQVAKAAAAQVAVPTSQPTALTEDIDGGPVRLATTQLAELGDIVRLRRSSKAWAPRSPGSPPKKSVSTHGRWQGPRGAWAMFATQHISQDMRRSGGQEWESGPPPRWRAPARTPPSAPGRREDRRGAGRDAPSPCTPSPPVVHARALAGAFCLAGPTGSV